MGVLSRTRRCCRDFAVEYIHSVFVCSRPPCNQSYRNCCSIAIDEQQAEEAVCTECLRGCVRRFVVLTSGVSFAFLFLALFLTSDPPASALPPPGGSVRAIPAFARKYGMPCSSCHEAWPMLSPFGQAFKDNGYQLGNDRDAPIYQQPGILAGHLPHHSDLAPRERKSGGGGWTGRAIEQLKRNVTTHGFDWSGLDFHTGGTLAKNVSFYVLPSSDNTGAFHFETVFARLDNLAGTSWLNFKLGKFELDNLLSEKRILTLTNVAGVYTNYHFQPLTEGGGAHPVRIRNWRQPSRYGVNGAFQGRSHPLFGVLVEFQ